MNLSLIVAAHNEEDNILLLYESIRKHVPGCEAIMVNDGSTDRTLAQMKSFTDIKLIDLKKRTGKSYALYTGIQNATREVIAVTDADMQLNTSDILVLLKKLREGYDLVCGWRHDRKDNWIRRMSSNIGNSISNRVLNMNLHDNNCPLQVMRRRCIQHVEYFNNFHRFLPYLVKKQGFKICEQEVSHHPRRFGYSKSGIKNRAFGNLITLLELRQGKHSLPANARPTNQAPTL